MTLVALRPHGLALGVVFSRYMTSVGTRVLESTYEESIAKTTASASGTNR